MKRQAYYPSRIADQIQWLENFRSKIPGYLATLGLDSTEVSAIVNACRFLIYVYSQWLVAVRAFGPAATDAIDLLLSGTGTSVVALPTFIAPSLPQGVFSVAPGMLTRLFLFVQKIKDATAYTPVIGEDLGIIGAEDAASHPVPVFSLDLLQGIGVQTVRISFFKYTHQGAYIEGRRGGGPWEFLGIDTESPYVDERPLLVAGQPEVREYRLRYWDKGTPNGDWSDTAKMTVAP